MRNIIQIITTDNQVPSFSQPQSFACLGHLVLTTHIHSVALLIFSLEANNQKNPTHSFKMKLTIVASVLALVAPIAAGPAAQTPNNFFELEKRATLPVPASKGSVTYKAAKEISGTFDGGMKTYGRGVSCTGQAEGGDADAVFILKNGATLKNAIIGKDQIEGVHCEGACNIENVWWVDVCEGKS